jgi:hypothetical protein
LEQAFVIFKDTRRTLPGITAGYLPIITAGYGLEITAGYLP